MQAKYPELFEELKATNIPRKSSTNTRRGFPAGHRSMTLGITRARFHGTTGLSYYSKRHPKLYRLCLAFGRDVCPFPFNAIHINHNVECPPHYDAKNTGETCIAFFGNYTGGELVIEGLTLTDNTKPIIFDGATKLHWSNAVTSGDKYSLVFFNTGYSSDKEVN